MSQSNLAPLANYLCCLDFCSPLGSANSFKDLADCDPSASNTCPINVCGQRWTIRFASGPRLEGGRLGTNAPIVKDAARFETGTRKCGFRVAQLARVLGKLSDEGFEEAVTEAPWKSVRPFKVIFCHDLSEFETSHVSSPAPSVTIDFKDVSRTLR